MSRLDLETALARTGTHVCEFTRGYWIGIVQSMALDYEIFPLTSLPELYLGDLRRLLPHASLQVTRSRRLPNSVRVVSVLVRMPPPSTA